MVSPSNYNFWLTYECVAMHQHGRWDLFHILPHMMHAAGRMTCTPPTRLSIQRPLPLVSTPLIPLTPHVFLSPTPDISLIHWVSSISQLKVKRSKIVSCTFLNLSSTLIGLQLIGPNFSSWKDSPVSRSPLNWTWLERTMVGLLYSMHGVASL